MRLTFRSRLGTSTPRWPSSPLPIGRSTPAPSRARGSRTRWPWRRARGVEPEVLRAEPGIAPVVNVNSPRRVNREMAAGLMELARWGQPAIVTPFTLQGAMSPVTLAGALVQQNAEALGVIALVQMTAPGAPVMY